METDKTIKTVELRKWNAVELRKWNAVAQWGWALCTDTCAICRNDLYEPSIEYQAAPTGDLDSPGLAVAWGVCGHVFHQDCVQRWLRTRSACPLCNKEWDFSKVERIAEKYNSSSCSTRRSHPCIPINPSSSMLSRSSLAAMAAPGRRNTLPLAVRPPQQTRRAKTVTVASSFFSPPPRLDEEQKRIDTSGTAQLVRAFGLRRRYRMGPRAVFELNYVRVMTGLREPDDVGRMTPAQRAFLRRLLSDALEGDGLGEEGKKAVRDFVHAVELLTAEPNEKKIE